MNGYYKHMNFLGDNYEMVLLKQNNLKFNLFQLLINMLNTPSTEYTTLGFEETDLLLKSLDWLLS